MVLVSVVVIAHNEEECIAGCLESVLGQTVGVDEALLILDSSTDRTEEIASQYPVDIYEVEYGSIYPTKRLSVCAARNDVVLAVDGDTVLASDFLERGLRHLEEGYDVASGHTHSQERTPLGDFAAWVCNICPKSLWVSGPAFVFDRRAYMDVCKVQRINGFVDICADEPEIPLQYMNLIKDPEMRLWTELPSTGQKRMMTGTGAVGGLLMALKVLA